MKIEVMGERIAFRIEMSLPKFRWLIGKRKLRELRLKAEADTFRLQQKQEDRSFGEPCIAHGVQNCMKCLEAGFAVKAAMIDPVNEIIKHNAADAIAKVTRRSFKR